MDPLLSTTQILWGKAFLLLEIDSINPFVYPWLLSWATLEGRSLLVVAATTFATGMAGGNAAAGNELAGEHTSAPRGRGTATTVLALFTVIGCDEALFLLAFLLLLAL
jgi:hypothetical protein